MPVQRSMAGSGSQPAGYEDQCSWRVEGNKCDTLLRIDKACT